MPALDAIAAEKTAQLEAKSRLRRLRTVVVEEGITVSRDGSRLLSFSGNDYLGLANHSAIKQAMQDALSCYGAGAGASRLVTGNHPLYDPLESALAAYKGTEAALVFGSGYLANIGVIPALVGREDLVVADKLVHACILDGIKLSGAKLLRFKHNDAADAERLLQAHRLAHRHALLITETVFSMDGDLSPLVDLRRIADKHDAWLMTDDAHGIGRPQPVKVDVQMGTLSKALGSYGGYIAGSQALIDYIVSTTRSFIFSTGLPPATIAAATAALNVLSQEPERADKALGNARRFASLLGLPEAQSTIVPLVLGEEEKALAAAQSLEEAGFLVAAIRPPTVPEGTSRLRFAFSALHTERDIERLVEVIRRENLIP